MVRYQFVLVSDFSAWSDSYCSSSCLHFTLNVLKESLDHVNLILLRDLLHSKFLPTFIYPLYNELFNIEV